jgi:predicted nucleotidyltransferase
VRLDVTFRRGKMGKTASDLRKEGWPPDEMQKYHPWQAAERYTEDPHAEVRRERAMEISREAAHVLRNKYGATRVVLFGSLARTSLLAPTSDIDLYAEGVPGSRFFEAEAEIEKVAKGFRVDLVEPKECTPQLLKEIEDEGIDL